MSKSNEILEEGLEDLSSIDPNAPTKEALDYAALQFRFESFASWKKALETEWDKELKVITILEQQYKEEWRKYQKDKKESEVFSSWVQENCADMPDVLQYQIIENAKEAVQLAERHLKLKSWKDSIPPRSDVVNQRYYTTQFIEALEAGDQNTAHLLLTENLPNLHDDIKKPGLYQHLIPTQTRTPQPEKEPKISWAGRTRSSIPLRTTMYYVTDEEPTKFYKKPPSPYNHKRPSEPDRHPSKRQKVLQQREEKGEQPSIVFH